MQPVAPETDADIEHWLDGDQPKWDAVDFELPCSRCGYDLRMLTLPRCPECGLQFAWRDIFEARRRRRHEFLFEYCWRDRPIRSWLLTAFRGLRPRRFWERTSIHEHVRKGPLLFFLVSAVPAFLLTMHAMAGLALLVFWLLDRTLSARATGYFGTYVSPLAVLAQYARAVATLPVIAGLNYVCLAGAVLLDVVAATALLASLRQTLGRCRVRPVQVLRVAAYATVPAVAVTAVAVFLCGVGAACLLAYGMPLGVALGNVLAFGLCVTIPGAYLGTGLRRYLQLPRPWLLGLTASAVAMLLTFTAVMFTIVLLAGGW